tara:strand:+ start:506 stop:769 length:264 start_codon:yes stop_codon:yes gene_type:complete
MSTHDLKCVKLWIREEGHNSPRRLITTITSTSKFKTMPWFNRLNNATDDDLIRAAKDQRNGWRHNGPWPNAVFEIEAHPKRAEEYLV